MTKTTKDDVVLGSGDLYIVEDTNDALKDLVIGSNDFYQALEVEENQIGHVKGGATLSYTSEWKKVKDDYKVTVKQFLTNEEVKFKGGILAWNGDILTTLCATGRKETTDEYGITLYKFGGVANTNGKSYYIHFRHRKDNGSYVRVTIIGVCENGFTLAFDPENETVLDPEFSAQGNTKDKGTLVYYSEQTMVNAATPIATPGASAVSSGTTVALSTSTPDADIYYTLDGSVPTKDDTKYTTPIEINAETTIKAIAVKAGMLNSEVLTAEYTIS